MCKKKRFLIFEYLEIQTPYYGQVLRQVTGSQNKGLYKFTADCLSCRDSYPHFTKIPGVLHMCTVASVNGQACSTTINLSKLHSQNRFTLIKHV